MNTYQFTLILDGVNQKTANLEDSIYEAGCDDALINFRNNTVYLDFDREASNIEDAILSAINDIEQALPDIQVVSIAPDDLVSESEIAKRANVKRQTVSLWVKGGRRRNNPFPHPVMGLTNKSPLWRWSSIAKWLHDEKYLNDQEIVNKAVLIEMLNSILMERFRKDTKKYRNQLMSKIKGNSRNAA